MPIPDKDPREGHEHLSAQVGKMPWTDLKVAFDAPDVCNTLEEAFESFAALSYPPGWRVDEVDAAGARLVVVFRVEGVPTYEDGQAVVTALEEFRDKKTLSSKEVSVYRCVLCKLPGTWVCRPCVQCGTSTFLLTLPAAVGQLRQDGWTAKSVIEHFLPRDVSQEPLVVALRRATERDRERALGDAKALLRRADALRTHPALAGLVCDAKELVWAWEEQRDPQHGLYTGFYAGLHEAEQRLERAIAQAEQDLEKEAARGRKQRR